MIPALYVLLAILMTENPLPVTGQMGFLSNFELVLGLLLLWGMIFRVTLSYITDKKSEDIFDIAAATIASELYLLIIVLVSVYFFAHGPLTGTVYLFVVTLYLMGLVYSTENTSDQKLYAYRNPLSLGVASVFACYVMNITLFYQYPA